MTVIDDIAIVDEIGKSILLGLLTVGKVQVLNTTKVVDSNTKEECEIYHVLIYLDLNKTLTRKKISEIRDYFYKKYPDIKPIVVHNNKISLRIQSIGKESLENLMYLSIGINAA